MEVVSEGTGVRVRLLADEADLLRRLVDELGSLLYSEHDRSDPVTSRLFPDAYDEDEDAESYRELTQDGLLAEKLDALGEVTETLGEEGAADALLAPESVERWLTALTDLRLAIGARLEIDEERMETEIDPGDPQAPALSVLHWLGWVQESLLREAFPSRP